MKHKKDEIQEVESCTKHFVNYLTREKPLLQCLWILLSEMFREGPMNTTNFSPL